MTEVTPEDALQVAQTAMSRISDLEERVAELESGKTADYDERDTAVVAQLEPGETVPIQRLHTLYRAQTDIRSDSTLKKRIRALVAGPDFRIVGAGEILYDPVGDDDE